MSVILGRGALVIRQRKRAGEVKCSTRGRGGARGCAVPEEGSWREQGYVFYLSHDLDKHTARSCCDRGKARGRGGAEVGGCERGDEAQGEDAGRTESGLEV
jgi:hypothetical protein